MFLYEFFLFTSGYCSPMSRINHNSLTTRNTTCLGHVIWPCFSLNQICRIFSRPLTESSMAWAWNVTWPYFLVDLANPNTHFFYKQAIKLPRVGDLFGRARAGLLQGSTTFKGYQKKRESEDKVELHQRIKIFLFLCFFLHCLIFRLIIMV